MHASCTRVQLCRLVLETSIHSVGYCPEGVQRDHAAIEPGKLNATLPWFTPMHLRSPKPL